MSNPPPVSLARSRARLSAIVFACLTAITFVTPAGAQVVYRYTGNTFNSFSSPSSYSTSDFVTATIELAAPLAPNLTSQNISGLAGFRLTLNDRHQTMVATAGYTGGFEAVVSTDANGQIVAPWSLIVNCCFFPNNGIAAMNSPGFRGVADIGTLSAPSANNGFPNTPLDQGRRNSAPGSWAPPKPAIFRITPTCGPNLSQVTATGSHYPPSATVQIAVGGTAATSVVTDASGSFQTTFELSTATGGELTVSATSAPVTESQSFFAGACGPVSTLTEVQGSLEVLQPDGTWKKAAAGDVLSRNDVIRTLDNSRARVLFADNTEFTLPPNAKLRMDEFDFEPTNNDGSLLLTLMVGSFRYVSGLLAKDPSHDNKIIDVPQAFGNIGIRGTEFVTRYDDVAKVTEIYLIDGTIALPANSTNEIAAPASIAIDASGDITVSPLTQAEYDALLEEIFPPEITSFTPSGGPVGTGVTINGTRLSGATAVAFNGLGATVFTVLSPTQLTATVPAGASTGPISVTAAAGTGTSATAFTVTGPVPSITSFTPGTGGVGTAVTIKGVNLSGVTAVKFNGTTATFKLKGSTQVATAVPVGATTGPITVTTSNGVATSASNFIVPTAPSISGFSPSSGPGNTVVTITGTDFTGASAVKIGTSSAKFTVVSPTSITATVPKGAKTGVVSVTTPGGTATSAAAFTVTK